MGWDEGGRGRGSKAWLRVGMGTLAEILANLYSQPSKLLRGQ